jgi:Gpi18-like mannosyltransferase
MVASLVWLFRRAPRWAILGAAGVALNPAVILVSAWWGQYESVYTALALVAIVLAAEGRVVAGGVAVALSVMTKPQALPFLLPYGAWVGGRWGPRRMAAAAGAGALVIVALWLPFVAAGGPLRFLDTLRSLQDGPYAVVTLNAWNFWGLVQGPVEPGGLAIPDSATLVGPLSARLIGLTLAGGCMFALVVATWRHPSRATLVVAMSSAALIAFAFLTTMHERYLFPVAVLPLALVWWRPARWGVVVISPILLAQLVATPGAGLVDAGARSALDLLRVPISAVIVLAAFGSISLVASRRLPADAVWDEALTLPTAAPKGRDEPRRSPNDGDPRG